MSKLSRRNTIGGIEAQADVVAPADRLVLAVRARTESKLSSAIMGEPDHAMKQLTILLAEDVNMVRGALVALLNLEPDLTVVADVDLPGIDVLTAAALLHDKLPSCRTLILTSLGRPGTLRRALTAHVAGFLL